MKPVERAVYGRIVTRSMQQAAHVSYRTAFFLTGELVRTGAPEGIYTTPGDGRIKDFIDGRSG